MKRRGPARNPLGRRPLVRSVPRGFARDAYDHKGRAYDRLRKRTGLTCEACKHPCRRPGNPSDRQLPAYRIVHQDGRGSNYCDDNLVLMCEHCYNQRYQHRMDT